MRAALLVLWLLCVSEITAQTLSSPHTADGQTNDEHLTFAVSTVKPSRSEGWKMFFTTDGFTSAGVTLQMLVQEAYGAYSGDYVTGGPSWAIHDLFDVEAKLDPEEIPQFRDLSLMQRRAMLQALLADRFHLSVHREVHVVSGYVISIGKGGPKLASSDSGAGHKGGVSGYDCSVGGRGAIMGEIKAKNCNMTDLSSLLSNTLAPKVVDQTGLKGRYSFDLHWTPDQQGPFTASDPSGTSADYPGLSTAIREQLGLTLTAAKVPVAAVVIDHAEQPTNN